MRSGTSSTLIHPANYLIGNIGGGIWHADAPPLTLLRRAISKTPSQLKQILLMDGIAKDFLDIKGHVDEQTVVNAFVARNSEDALKTAPKVIAIPIRSPSSFRLSSSSLHRNFPLLTITSERKEFDIDTARFVLGIP